MKLKMLSGLPGSGKTTHARELVDKGWVRVNKDDLRAMLHNSQWSKSNEKQVLHLRDQVITDALRQGKSVVVDDTNMAPKHKERLSQLARELKATFETKFFDVDVEECIKRDLQRQNSVGEKVIRNMYRTFLAPPQEVYTLPANKPLAILCDIDGTLAHMVSRGPYDWNRINEDTLDFAVYRVLERMNTPDIRIILLSGRDGSCYDLTVDWLHDKGVPYDLLFMRAENDNRKDTIVKRELFEKHVRHEYGVLFAIDDRPSVCRMWRNELGLKVLQVGDPDFEF